MKVIETAEDALFRQEVRAWLADNVPRDKRPPEGEGLRTFDLAWAEEAV